MALYRDVVGLLVAALNEPGAEQLPDVADLFDQYRRHYREPVSPGQTLRWLRDHVGAGRLTVFVAHVDDRLVGFATVMVVPASLRLGHHWVLRDLFVLSDARRGGTGRALLGVVSEAATASGALRLSVQTEADNAPALRLYHASGFASVEGITSLTLPLQHPAGD